MIFKKHNPLRTDTEVYGLISALLGQEKITLTIFSLKCPKGILFRGLSSKGKIKSIFPTTKNRIREGGELNG